LIRPEGRSEKKLAIKGGSKQGPNNEKTNHQSEERPPPRLKSKTEDVLPSRNQAYNGQSGKLEKEGTNGLTGKRGKKRGKKPSTRSRVSLRTNEKPPTTIPETAGPDIEEKKNGRW